MTGPKSKNQAHHAPCVCGIDEAGRGPLAGPVVAAAVILPPNFASAGLADSKALSPRQREVQHQSIVTSGAMIGLGWVWPEEIDRLNIHQASLRAMDLAWLDLARRNPGAGEAFLEFLVDGLYCPSGLPHASRAVVGGDRLIPEIMAASIMAKTSRDAWMVEYAAHDPRYGFERHKGYPTRSHRAAIEMFGPCQIHRRSFRGVRGSVHD